MKPDRTWHVLALDFWKRVHCEFQAIPKDSDAIIYGACRLLDSYHKAQDVIQAEGPIVYDGDRPRANPAIDVSTKSWAGFLRACKMLGIGEDQAPAQKKNPVGRPPKPR